MHDSERGIGFSEMRLDRSNGICIIVLNGIRDLGNCVWIVGNGV